MVVFDTNTILRYVLQDNTTMANAVDRMLSVNAEKCMIPVEVVAEMVYVLSKVYKIDRSLIAQTIEGVADINDGLVVNSSVVRSAVQLYAATNLDFVDCLLAGYARVNGYSVFTFDKELQKYI